MFRLFQSYMISAVESQVNSDHTHWLNQLDVDSRDRGTLMHYLLSYVSPELFRYAAQSLARENKLTLFRTMRRLHNSVASGSNQFRLRKFISLFRNSIAVVRNGFESTWYPGFVSLDLIDETVFINGLSKTYFGRSIQRPNEGFSVYPCIDAVAKCQQYVTSHLPVSKAPSAPVEPTRALVAATGKAFAVPSSSKPRRPSLGTQD